LAGFLSPVPAQQLVNLVKLSAIAQAPNPSPEKEPNGDFDHPSHRHTRHSALIRLYFILHSASISIYCLLLIPLRRQTTPAIDIDKSSPTRSEHNFASSKA